MKYLSNYNLKNKRVLVLGGSGTIGKEVCLALKEHKAHITNLDLKDDIISVSYTHLTLPTTWRV